MKQLGIIALLACVTVALATSGCSDARDPSRAAEQGKKTDSDVLVVAKQVVDAFKARDAERLAELTHPQKGVRFSPYAYVDEGSDRVLSRTEIEGFWQAKTAYRWGFADGTGDPIDMTPRQYFERFIMDRDFAHPSSIKVNDDRASGNTGNNAASVYPQGARVEYYVGPEPGQGEPEIDWAALRLVFEELGGSWYLIAVIHDEWTT